MNNFLQGKIDRFEEACAVIIFSDGQTLNWPRAKLADDILAGAVVRIYLDSNPEETGAEENLAKDVLNEILEKE